MPSSSDSSRSTVYALAKYALENGSVATRYFTLRGTPAMSTPDSPNSTSMVDCVIRSRWKWQLKKDSPPFGKALAALGAHAGEVERQIRGT